MTTVTSITDLRTLPFTPRQFVKVATIFARHCLDKFERVVHDDLGPRKGIELAEAATLDATALAAAASACQLSISEGYIANSAAASDAAWAAFYAVRTAFFAATFPGGPDIKNCAEAAGRFCEAADVAYLTELITISEAGFLVKTIQSVL